MNCLFLSLPALPPCASRWVLRACTLGGLGLGALAAQAQPAAAAAAESAAAPSALEVSPLSLRSSPRLVEQWPQGVGGQLPVFVRADHIEGETDVRVQLRGDVQLRRGETILRADWVDYDLLSDRAHAGGRVRVHRADSLYEGSMLDLQVDAFSGFFQDTRYRLLDTGAHGDASRTDFIDSQRSVVHDATYTTCQRNEEASWQPDWVLRARRLELDREADEGVARGAVLEFKGVPLLPVPYISFPLSGKRKSGLLPPTLGLDSLSGLTYAQPYYWNIAPNRDATFTPVLMSRRGLALGAELRYLEPTHSGELNLNYMPHDSLRHRDRWSYALRQRSHWSTPVGGVGLQWNVQRASDDDYWRDFSQRAGLGLGGDLRSNEAQRLLPGDAMLSWSRPNHVAFVRTLKWQTLQDPSAPIAPPYDRLPQLQWRYTPLDLPVGLEVVVEADYTHFRADRRYYNQPNGERTYALAQVSRTFQRPGGYIRPRLQLHTTRYTLDQPLANGQRSADRSLPTFSLDSGLVFERDAQYWGRSFVQTLEPRAFYTYTPYRDQSLLPVYDSAQNDFNFASVFTENAFGGHDRLADNNLLTLGLTTRLLEPNTGAEAVRFGIAQRLRFADQRVTLPGGSPVSERLSDVLLGAGLNWTPQWGLDATVQYNPKTGRSLRSTVAGRYSPGKYRTVSLAYRMQKETDLITEPSEQLDLGWQWPLDRLLGQDSQRSGPTPEAGRWYSVGRMNYSLQERKLVDTVIGLEYQNCCWVGRVVLERLQRSNAASNTRVMLQLEFTGFSSLSLGANPLSSLQQNVPRYQPLEAPRAPASRFTDFD